jgi:hypothetical protein
MEAGASCVEEEEAPCGIREWRFAESTPEATIHFHVQHLGRQLYVWVSADGAKLGSLCMAVQTRLVRASRA